MARFRLGSKLREGRYWEDEQRLCRLCEAEMETWEHVWERYRKWREGQGSWQEALRWVLGKEEEGEWWMREIKEARGEGKKEGSLKAKWGGVGNAAEKRER